MGNWGNDTIIAGPGRDTVRGDNSRIGAFGNDLIDVRDGEVDQVDCGVGRDTVIADRRDIVSTNCEVIRQVLRCDSAATVQAGDELGA